MSRLACVFSVLTFAAAVGCATTPPPPPSAPSETEKATFQELDRETPGPAPASSTSGGQTSADAPQ